MVIEKMNSNRESKLGLFLGADHLDGFRRQVRSVCSHHHCLLDVSSLISSALPVYLEVRSDAIELVVYHPIQHNTSAGFFIARNISSTLEVLGDRYYAKSITASMTSEAPTLL